MHTVKIMNSDTSTKQTQRLRIKLDDVQNMQWNVSQVLFRTATYEKYY